MLKNGRFTSPIITCKGLYELLELEDVIILDVRVKSRETLTSEVCIPNARYINIKENLSDTAAKFPNAIPSEHQFENEIKDLGINKDSIIVVYDDKGIYWSARVWWLFKTFGFDAVSVLDGGLPEWKRLGYKTNSSLASPNWASGNFSAVYQKNKMCYFKDITKLSRNEKVLVLDARSEDRFLGHAPEPRAGLRSGTVPNSKNLPYTRLFEGHCLKSKTELMTIFDTFDLGDRTLIFSCGSGITACILALAAEICEYKNLLVYDGSWTEYGTLTT